MGLGRVKRPSQKAKEATASKKLKKDKKTLLGNTATTPLPVEQSM
jgi:hypothetical protein